MSICGMWKNWRFQEGLNEENIQVWDKRKNGFVKNLKNLSIKNAGWNKKREKDWKIYIEIDEEKARKDKIKKFRLNWGIFFYKYLFLNILK